MSGTYGEKPRTFSFEEGGEQYMIGGEVGNYLRLTRGVLYKKYPSLTRRKLTNVERIKLVESGHPQFVNIGRKLILLLLASEVEDILEGRDELFKRAREETSTNAPAAQADTPKPASIVPAMPNSAHLTRPKRIRTTIVTDEASEDEIMKDIDNGQNKERKSDDDEYNPVESDGKKLKVRSNLRTVTVAEKMHRKRSELDNQIQFLEREEKAGRLVEYEQKRLDNMRERRLKAQALELVGRPTDVETSNAEPPIQKVVEVATAENEDDGNSSISINEGIGGIDPLSTEEEIGVSPPHSTPEVG